MIEAPTDTLIAFGTRRWLVTCISDTMVMSCGEWHQPPRDPFSFGTPWPHYRFGPEIVGAALETVPASHWTPDTRRVVIDPTGTPGTFKVVLRNHRSSDLRVMLEDDSVFGRYGFLPPNLA